MDETDPIEEDDAPPPTPRAFGMPAHPAGYGLLGGTLFALAVAPVALASAAANSCFDFAADCPLPPEGAGLGLARIAWSGAAFGMAAWLVGRRLAPSA